MTENNRNNNTGEKKRRSRYGRRRLLKITGASVLSVGSGCLRLQQSDNTDTQTANNTPTATEIIDTATPETENTQTPTSPETNPEEDYPELGNFPIEGDEVVYGFNVPQSGPYSQEGQDQLRGYNLAVKHLNNGGGWVDSWNELTGDGILDKTVTTVEGDTATDPDQARQSLSKMIETENVIMCSGGSSSATAIAQQRLCQREKVQFMCGVTSSNTVTGAECARYSFREMANNHMIAQTLASSLGGDELNFYQLFSDYSWGRNLSNLLKRFLENEEWYQIESVPTPIDTSDYSSYIADIPRDQTDVLVLVHYGLEAANVLVQALNANLDDDMTIIVPLFNRLFMRAASGAIEGVWGTADWSWQLQDPRSLAFTRAFRSEYNKVPSYAARLAYTSTLSYSAAVVRAGTFYPPEVIKQLEDWEYNRAGLGKEIMRGCDHQAQRDVLIVRGLSESNQTDDKLVEIVDQVDKNQLGYACDTEVSAECSLGTYD